MEKPNSVIVYSYKVFPWVQGPPETSIDANGISIVSVIFAGDRPTDTPTVHATLLVTIGDQHSGDAKFCYSVRLQQVFIGAVDLTDRINFSNQQLYSAVRLDGLRCMWRHTTI